MEFLEIVASTVFVNELFISVFTSYRNIHKEQHQKPKIKYQHQPKPNPPHIKIQPHLLIRRRIPINPQGNPLNGKHHSKHPQQHKLHHQPIDIPPLLREGPGQTEPYNLADLQHGEHHHLKIAVGVEDGEGEHHEDFLYVAEDVVVVGLEVVFDGGLAAVGVLVLAVADVLEDAAVFCDELLVLGAAEFGVGVVHEVVEAVDVVAEVVDGDEDADGQRGDPHWLTNIEIREFEEYCEREVH